MEITDLLKLSVERKASDLHILPGFPPMMRIDGDIVSMEDAKPLTPEETKRIIYSIMNSEEQKSFETTLEFGMAIKKPGVGIFRASVLHQLRGVAAVFRIIPENVPSFEELLLPPVLKSLLNLPHGLVLVTGATGSGKSSTLAAMVDYINANLASHIITIEDPIEFIHSNKKSIINQRQIHRDTPSFPMALHSALRQDPDVILLGEMRDLETISLALTAAETGHLVMATLHASSAPLTVNRIVDVFPPDEKNRVRNLLAESLQAVICQSLIKRISGGRVGAFEIMLATPAIRHLIRQDKSEHISMAIQTGGDVGMCTFDQYLQQLVAKRLISNATARSTAINQERFQAG